MIGEGSLIGHGSTLTTHNHGVAPAGRADMLPALRSPAVANPSV
jgi:hypothetical protein